MAVGLAVTAPAADDSSSPLEFREAQSNLGHQCCQREADVRGPFPNCLQPILTRCHACCLRAQCATS